MVPGDVSLPPSSAAPAAAAVDPRAALDMIGGETRGLERVAHYLFSSRAIERYKDTRNGLIGADYSSKFSPWLSLGCLSPRLIYWEIQRFEKQHVANDSTYWLVFELLWRDFFRMWSIKVGRSLFFVTGPKHVHVTWLQDKAAFERWRTDLEPRYQRADHIHAGRRRARHRKASLWNKLARSSKARSGTTAIGLHARSARGHHGNGGCRWWWR
jgi:hypothetical protein